MIEANIRADAEPAAMALRTIAIISCPAPFERLEVFREPQPSATGRPGSLMKIFDRRHTCRRSRILPDHVRQQTEETRALDGALGHGTHQKLGILVVDLRRIRTRERAGLATAEKRTACTSFSHDAYSSIAASSSRERRGPRSPR